MCERRDGRPGLNVPNSPYGLISVDVKSNIEFGLDRAQELCESRGDRSPVPNSPYGLCGRKATLN